MGRELNPQRYRAIKDDAIREDDYKRYVVPHPSLGPEGAGGFFCDNCVHFAPQAQACSMGWAPRHTFAIQNRNYLENGRIAFCRFHELD